MEASQSVVEVINFMETDGKEKNDEGYYGLGSKNLPIFSQLKLDSNFDKGQRIGIGTHIIGFIEQYYWVESIVYSVINSFLIVI